MKERFSGIPFLVLIAVSLLGVVFSGVPTKAIVHDGIVAGDVAWMLCSAGLVLLMTPGLALFYGGMVSVKNIISTMLQSFICMGIVSILWIVVGFSLAFGDSIGGIIGDPRTFFMFKGVLESKPWPLASTIPLVLFAFFQLKFAVISPALITGSFSERIRFTSYILFVCLFSMLIYAPIAHWTWHPNGILFKMGVLDFAGGTVVHISAGCSALAAAWYLGKRKSAEIHSSPSNVPFVLTGTGLLWFGWFGFNAGSAVGANTLAATALATTNTAAAAGGMAWMLFDSFKGKKPSALGFCMGAVVGLVAITPAAGFVTVPNSIFIGTFSSIISNMVVGWSVRTNIDDTLDVFPCHGVGAMVGMLLTGIFANKAVNPAVEVNGLFYGELGLFLAHLAGLGIVVTYSLIGSYVLLKVTDLISPLRVTKEEEIEGLDFTQHGEKMTVRA